jgi:hypothetical protein
MGSWATCGASCQFNVDLFSAIGTWVGGVGLALGALILTASQAREQARRRKQEATGTAIMCVLRAKPVLDGAVLVRVEFSFENKTSRPVDDVSAYMKGGPTLRRDLRVWPGRTWGCKGVDPTALGLPGRVASEIEARSLVKERVMPNLVFSFTIDGFRFIRNAGGVYPLESAPNDLRQLEA